MQMNEVMKSNYFFIIIGLIFIFVFLYPFWFAGEYSALGWYDEVNAQIPANFLNINLKDGQSFIHEYAGGMPTLLNYGADKFSIKESLLEILPLWQANLIFRLGSLFSFFLGGYFLLIHIYSANKLLAFSLSMYALSISYLPYGWSLNGHGWDLSIVLFLTLAILGKFESFKINILIGIITSVIAPFISGPIFLYPFLFFLLLFILITHLGIKYLSKERWILFLGIILISLIVYLYNWAYLYFVLVDSKDFSARILGTLANVKYEGSFLNKLYFYIVQNYDEFIKYHTIFAVSYIYYGYFIVLFFVFLQKKLNKLVSWILFIGFFTIVFESLMKAIDLPFFNTFRWGDVVLLLLPIIVIVSIAHLNSRKYILINFFIFILLLYPTYSAFKVYIGYSVATMNKRGGSGVVTKYEELKKLDNSYRTVVNSDDMYWATPLYYGLSTFDGTARVFSERRMYFISYGIFINKLDVYSPSNHFFYFNNDEIYYKMKFLEMANIKYILSTHIQLKQNLKMTLYISGKKYKDIDLFYKNIFYKYRNIKLLNDLYVHELNKPWERVFVANEVKNSRFSYRDKHFYEDLEEVGFQNILIAKDDKNKLNNTFNNNLFIVKTEITKKGIDVEVRGSGVLVYNQVYLPRWEAKCNETELKITPVNGIMMAINVPLNCKRVRFKYNDNI